MKFKTWSTILLSIFYYRSENFQFYYLLFVDFWRIYVNYRNSVQKGITSPIPLELELGKGQRAKQLLLLDICSKFLSLYMVLLMVDVCYFAANWQQTCFCPEATTTASILTWCLKSESEQKWLKAKLNIGLGIMTNILI